MTGAMSVSGTVVYPFREVWRGKQSASQKYLFPFCLEWKKDSGQEMDETRNVSYQSPW